MDKTVDEIIKETGQELKLLWSGKKSKKIKKEKSNEQENDG